MGDGSGSHYITGEAPNVDNTTGMFKSMVKVEIKIG